MNNGSAVARHIPSCAGQKKCLSGDGSGLGQFHRATPERVTWLTLRRSTPTRGRPQSSAMDCPVGRLTRSWRRRLIGDEPAPVGAGVLKQWMGGTHPAFRGARRASGIRARFSEGTRMRSLMAGSIVARQYARCRLINSPHLLLAAADLYVVVAMDPTPGAEPGHRRRAGRVVTRRATALTAVVVPRA